MPSAGVGSEPTVTSLQFSRRSGCLAWHLLQITAMGAWWLRELRERQLESSFERGEGNNGQGRKPATLRHRQHYYSNAFLHGASTVNVAQWRRRRTKPYLGRHLAEAVDAAARADARCVCVEEGCRPGELRLHAHSAVERRQRGTPGSGRALHRPRGVRLPEGGGGATGRGAGVRWSGG